MTHLKNLNAMHTTSEKTQVRLTLGHGRSLKLDDVIQEYMSRQSLGTLTV